MTPRPLFPKAKPTKAAPRKRTWKPKELRTHVLISGDIYDWDGVAICADADCGFRRDHRVHDLTQEYSAEAAEIEARKLGEGE